MLNLKPWTVYQKIKAGVIPGVRIDRTLRVDPKELKAFIKSRSTVRSRMGQATVDGDFPRRILPSSAVARKSQSRTGDEA